MRSNTAADSLLEFLFPSNARCIGCGASAGTEENWLCGECAGLLNRMDITLSADSEAWPENGLSFARGVYRYSRPVTGIIHALKYDGVYTLADWITEEMSLSLLDWAYVKADCLVPVPMHVYRQRLRGYNQSSILARSLCEKTGIPVYNALKRAINTKQQARCADSERHSNIKGAFGVIENVEGMSIMLVDDVITSGATANACASVLRGAGAKDVNIITLAAARG